jgi:hypothetical protein
MARKNYSNQRLTAWQDVARACMDALTTWLQPHFYYMLAFASVLAAMGIGIAYELGEGTDVRAVIGTACASMLLPLLCGGFGLVVLFMMIFCLLPMLAFAVYLEPCMIWPSRRFEARVATPRISQPNWISFNSERPPRKSLRAWGANFIL